MKIAIVGYSLEGRSSYKYFTAQGGHELTICDQDPALQVPEGAQSKLGGNYLDGLDQFDLIVRTAGLSPKVILEKNPGVSGKITSNTNEFFKAFPAKNTIGVTGTKGKGTTSTLIALMLKAAGKDAQLGGNIGVPALDLLPKLTENSWVVLELSSFQLIDMQHSPHIGVCLMMAPEHLDWHLDEKEYVEAKSQLFAHQAAKDAAIYFAENEVSKQIASTGSGQKIPYYAAPGAVIQNDAVVIDGQEICKTGEIKLLGKHNWQNVCAAVTAVWQVTQNTEALRSVITSFSGIEHRLELVHELDGVKYYDDSYGTTPETAMVALEAFTGRPVIIILGGRGKGIPFDELAKSVAKQNPKQVIAIGEAGPEIAGLLRKNGYDKITEGGKTVEEIVQQARKLATMGDIVLLSTAATSFDMFRNYKERGEQFTKAVQALV